MENIISERINEKYKEVTANYSFNNIRDLYTARGRSFPLPDSFGGNCVWLAKKIKVALADDGIYVTIHSAEDSLHHAAVANDPLNEDDFYFLDPSIHLKDPVYITPLLKESNVRETAPAYPYSPDFKHYSYTLIQSFREIITVTVIGSLSPVSNKAFLFSHNYERSSIRSKKTSELPEEIMQKNKKDNLLVRFVANDGSVNMILCDTYTGEMSFYSSLEKKFYDEGKILSTDLQQKITHYLQKNQLDLKELTRTMKDAVHLYRTPQVTSPRKGIPRSSSSQTSR